uniref:Uncharacterized protein n=1 Tax=Sphaerodactylus townsendi TaxID=933632 RepID=A0ACB8G3H8_9SAUR
MEPEVGTGEEEEVDADAGDGRGSSLGSHLAWGLVLSGAGKSSFPPCPGRSVWMANACESPKLASQGSEGLRQRLGLERQEPEAVCLSLAGSLASFPVGLDQQKPAWDGIRSPCWTGPDRLFVQQQSPPEPKPKGLSERPEASVGQSPLRRAHDDIAFAFRTPNAVLDMQKERLKPLMHRTRS